MADLDAIVVGGGIVGATAALALADLGRDVALVERRPPQYRPGRLGFDARTVALNAASRRLLEELDVWRSVPAQPIVAMRVWEAVGTASIHFDAASVDADALAWVFEVGRLTDALWSRCRDRVRVVAPATVEDLAVAAERATVKLGADTLTARLVIGADGAASRVRQLAGAEQARFAVGETAFATVARCAEPHRGQAFQCFTESGPLALLPLPEPQHVSVIWSVIEAQAARLRSLSAAEFGDALACASERALGDVVDVDAVAEFPLGQALVDDFNPAQRVLVIGDAARTLHPLAGQGVNLGLEDVRGIRAAVAADPRDLGRAGRWRRFARRRAARARLMLTAMAAFDRVYGQQDAALRWLRNVGIRFVDRAPLVKAQLIREAMGVGRVATSS